MSAAAQVLHHHAPTRQEQLETFGTSLWLLMDFLWLIEWPWAGSAAGAVGLAAHLVVFRYLSRNAAVWTANGSASCWLLMNFLWMVGESYQLPGPITAAKWVGSVAVALLALSVWSGGLSGPVMQQFRRIKVWQQEGEK